MRVLIGLPCHTGGGLSRNSMLVPANDLLNGSAPPLWRTTSQPTMARAEDRDGAKQTNQKRRRYRRRSGAPTRGTGPLRLALTGATRSGSAGVESPGSRSAGERYAASKWSQLERN